jgi:hypothetical protein
MSEFGDLLNAVVADASLLVLFIPSADRDGDSLGKTLQKRWVHKALKLLGQHFTGATAFPRGWGTWRDDAQGGRIVWDRPVLIQCFTSEAVILQHTPALRDFLVDMGIATNQGAVACVLNGVMYRINFSPGPGA